MINLTSVDAAGKRVLPVNYSDNYLSLFPGEKREVVVRNLGHAGPVQVNLRGWNIAPARLPTKSTASSALATKD